MNILLTGANGFVGKALLHALALSPRYQIKAVSRKSLLTLQNGITEVIIHSIDSKTDWAEAIKDIDVVIHTAARVHVMKDAALNPLEEYREINTRGTLNLAQQAANAGVNRFIYISSIKVNGEFTYLDKPFFADDSFQPNSPNQLATASAEGEVWNSASGAPDAESSVIGPTALLVEGATQAPLIDPYGLSKYDAEMGLQKIAKQTGMEVVIIRPTLVYGPGVKANFLSMMKWLYRGIPLPFGSIHNKRSLVALDNLISLIVTCLDHPNAANQTFLVSDDEDLSTTDLLTRVAHSLGKKSSLLPIPESLLRAGLNLCGKKDLAQRLLGSLQVDITKTKEMLNWAPIISVDDALKKTAQHFLSTHA